MKKILSLCLTLSLLLGLLAVPAAAADRQYVIGIAEAQANDEVTTRRAYLEKYIGPTTTSASSSPKSSRTTPRPSSSLKTASTPAATPSST